MTSRREIIKSFLWRAPPSDIIPGRAVCNPSQNRSESVFSRAYRTLEIIIEIFVRLPHEEKLEQTVEKLLLFSADPVLLFSNRNGCNSERACGEARVGINQTSRIIRLSSTQRRLRLSRLHARYLVIDPRGVFISVSFGDEVSRCCILPLACDRAENSLDVDWKRIEHRVCILAHEYV